jgi:hypothetical protein
MYTVNKIQVDCQAAIASKLAPTGDRIHPQKSGRPEGRHGQTIKPTLCEPETRPHKGQAKTKASTP